MVVERVKPKEGLASGFRTFISQYGVGPLAIGVIVGTAVNDFIKSLVDGLITPFIALVSPSSKLQSLQFTFHGSVFKIGTVINSLISFLLICLLVYLFAKIILRNEEILEKK